MDNDHNIFSISSEESHHGESLVSILIVAVSVSMIVGLFYSVMGANKSANAKNDSYVSDDNLHQKVYDDALIRFNIPEGFGLIEEDIITNDKLEKNKLSGLVYQSSDTLCRIILIKSQYDYDLSLMDIFPDRKSPTSSYPNPVLLSFSQIDSCQIAYEVMYQLDNIKLHSKEKLIKVRKDDQYFVYLITYQTPNDLWMDNTNGINEFFSSINMYDK